MIVESGPKASALPLPTCLLLSAYRSSDSGDFKQSGSIVLSIFSPTNSSSLVIVFSCSLNVKFVIFCFRLLAR